MTGARAILLDLDDTLYVCRPGEVAGLAAVASAASEALGLPPDAIDRAYVDARRAVKQRIDGRGSSHSRLLYLTEMVHALGRPDALALVRVWERSFWRAFVGASRLRARTLPFLEMVRASGRKVAIVTDLTLEVQLLKLEAFGLFGHVHALAVSEEVPLDKPAEEIFLLAASRLGMPLEACVMVGDHDQKDGEGARRLGIPYVPVLASDEHGAAFDALAGELGIALR